MRRGPAQALFRRNPSRLTQSLTCADKLCCGGLARDVHKLATREAAMLLIPVVLMIGGILALVLYLEKRSPPYRE
jgi:hypothetical protein